MKNSSRLLSGQKIFAVLVCIFACAGIVYLISPLMYSAYLTNYSTVKSGVISGTKFSFIVVDGPNYYIQNNATQEKWPLLEAPLDNLGYIVFQQGSDTYLIAKYYYALLGVPQPRYFVWDITSNTPRYINYAISCTDPKLRGHYLEFVPMGNCTGAWQNPQDDQIIDLN
jgi:hypothetical protein